MKSKRSSGGTKKYGRNKLKCARYRTEGRREKNKERRLLKLFNNIIRKNPDIKYRRIKNNLVKVKQSIT